MKNRRTFWRAVDRATRLLGLMVLLLAGASIALNVQLLRRIDDLLVTQGSIQGSTQTNLLEPDHAGAIASGHRANGTSTSTVNVLRRSVAARPLVANHGTELATEDATSVPAVATEPPDSSPSADSVGDSIAEISAPDTRVPSNGGGTAIPASNEPTAMRRQMAAGFAARSEMVAGTSQGAVRDAAATGQNPTTSQSPIVAPAANSQIPVAFQPLSPDLHLTEQQKQQVSQLQDQFVHDSGANSSAPANPDRWQTAVTQTDDQFRTWFGDMAVLAQQQQSLKAAP